MRKDDMLVALINEAKEDVNAADEMIRTYMPFIKNETAKFLRRPVIEENDCELSIAMMAFYEAVQGYSQMRGAFFSYASVHIKSRLIDYARKERKHKNLTPLETADGDEDEMSVTDKLTDGSDHAEEFSERNAARSEIEKFTKELEEFGLSLSDVSDHCPQQQRTLEACRKALDYAKENQEILDEFLRTKRLPIAQLSLGGGVERKTLERHRKYMVALLLACTNGFEIIRGHIKLVLSSEKI
ncbi:MAG: RNA polymerase subunit sigma [Ruminococcaceae bacterium]|nr:RNA polymerase subunit sigma [Oscillospiraceae bacterium]